jgi:hypothetical protein
MAVDHALTARGLRAKLHRNDDSQLPKALVRLGFVSRGVVYALIGALALALALGAAGGTATNQQGALELIDRAPLGAVALAVLAAGVLAYAAWKLWQAAFGHGPEGGGGDSAGTRVVNLAGGVGYLGLFALAIGVLVGGGQQSGGSGGPSKEAGGVLGWPGGQVIVAIVGAIALCVFAVQTYQGVTGQFLRQDKTEEIDRRARPAVEWVGRVGWIARAITIGLVGYFLIKTAVEYDPNKAVGLDGALRKVYAAPYGSALLAVVAGGLIAFALFSFAEARYRQL